MSISIIVSGEGSTTVTAPSGASNTISIGQDLSDFVKNSQTGSFYPASNPSGFVTGLSLTGFVEKSETGNYLTTGNISPLVRDFDVSGDFQVSGGSTFY